MSKILQDHSEIVVLFTLQMEALRFTETSVTVFAGQRGTLLQETNRC
jgi:hypothetical protein